MVEQLSFTEPRAKALKKEYEAAVNANKESFLFEGKHEFVTAYAKYMLEHLKNQGFEI